MCKFFIRLFIFNTVTYEYDIFTFIYVDIFICIHICMRYKRNKERENVCQFFILLFIFDTVTYGYDLDI
jgi:hypothetical protein